MKNIQLGNFLIQHDSENNISIRFKDSDVWVHMTDYDVGCKVGKTQKNIVFDKEKQPTYFS